jgi:dinuclear metal center YbgI/SA1388 family protein
MKISEITSFLESKAPLAYQEEYDNSGLIVGDSLSEVNGILVTVDVTGKVIEEAAKKSCNLIISHHPFIFKGLKKLTGEDPAQRTALHAIRSGIAIYAIHTNLDNIYDGFNSLLCSKLGMVNCKILLPLMGKLSKLVTFCPIEHSEKVRMALFEAGAGHIGNYDFCSFNMEGQGTFRASDIANPFVGKKNVTHFEKEIRIEVIFPSFLGKKLIASLLASHPYEEVAYDIYPLYNEFKLAGSGMIGELVKSTDEKEFLKKVREITGIPVIRHSEWLGHPVKKVALCGGAGSFLIPDAKNAGADLFLTGDIKYHDFFDVSGSILLADIGHYESEQFVREWLYDTLTEKFPNFAVLKSETNTNPVNYF